jgi:hypothetical protein
VQLFTFHAVAGSRAFQVGGAGERVREVHGASSVRGPVSLVPALAPCRARRP